MSFLDNLNWRQATKEFDNTKVVSLENLNKILEAIRMTPTSYGLQPFHVYIIKDLSMRKKIKLSAFLQKQIDTCSHLIVFCAIKNKEKMSQRINEYADLISQGDKMANLKLQAMKLMMATSIKTKSQEAFASWSAKQCYIALGFALAGAAELKIDSCPMEGFDKTAVDKILKLPDYLQSSVLLPIGYRKEEPKRAKTRFPDSDLFTHL